MTPAITRMTHTHDTRIAGMLSPSQGILCSVKVFYRTISFSVSVVLPNYTLRVVRFDP